ncbi:MAG: histidine kinase [Hydrogenophaga sp.]|nr:histidine kinase [Hydrogenophaga sp.]
MPSQRHPPDGLAEKLAHELHVHQIELESQNEELRRTKSDLSAARDRYQDLFDFAPVGYFTLDRSGVILECNLAGATLVGARRAELKGCSFSRFVSPSDGDRWHLYTRKVLGEDGPHRIELALQRVDSPDTWHGQIDCQLMALPGQESTLWVMLTDITARVLADFDQRVAALDADARELERHRVARALHEDLGQRLSALKMELASLSPSEEVAAYRERLGTLMASLDDAMSTVRGITQDLRPPMLNDLGLAAAIEWLADDTARRTGLSFTLSLDAVAPEMGEQSRLALYRFVQQAIALLDEAGSAELHIGTLCAPDCFVLVLRFRWQCQATSNTPSLDADAARILEHRARILGCRLVIDMPRDPQGWIHLELVMPMTGRLGTGALHGDCR